MITHPDSLKGNKITISIGTATYKVGDDETSIYARADKAVYQAKSQGRNCSVILANESHQNMAESKVD